MKTEEKKRIETKEVVVCDQIGDSIENRIITIRGVQVILDRDLADLYGVETRALNQAVSRNIERFPSEFRFQISKDEMATLKSHFVISSWGGTRKRYFIDGGVGEMYSISNI
ncbi:MAG: ORF6N domain-containing protein [Bacteroidales bacterium]|nr:ORF6N domain-containing protein [Bacteroidales bacterium]